MKYTKEELADMAKQTLAAFSSGDPRGLMVIVNLMSRFPMNQQQIVAQLQRLAEGV